MPERIQLHADLTLPPTVTDVSAGTRWGNPYLAGPIAASFPSLSERQVAQTVVNGFRSLIERGHGRAARGARLSSPQWEHVTYPSIAEIRAELAGKDLACWCELISDDGGPLPCHADVLLRVAAGGKP